MIKDKLLETDLTSYGIEYTKQIRTLQSSDPSLFEPYYMGYLNYENIPNVCKLYNATLDHGYLRVKEASEKSNYPWLYLGDTSVFYDVKTSFLLSTDDSDVSYWKNNEYTLIGGNTTNFRLINKCLMSNLSTSPYFWLSYVSFKRNFDGSISDFWGNNISFRSLETFKSFLDGELEVNFSVAGNNTLTLKYEPEGHEGIIAYHGSDYVHYIMFVDLIYRTGGYYYGSVDNSVYRSFIPALYQKFTTVNGNRYDRVSSCLGGVKTEQPYQGSWYYSDIYINKSTGVIGSNNNRILTTTIAGLVELELDIEAMSINSLYFINNALIWSASFYSNNLYIHTPKEIVKAFKYIYPLVHKISLRANYPEGFQYTDSTTVFLFNENDTPTSGSISGDYLEVESSLRPWQKIDADITDNEFDVIEDMPDYVPPDDGDEGEIPGTEEPLDPPLIEGDDIPLQLDRNLPIPTEFLTLYNITAEELSAFGKTLWTAINDYDPATSEGIESLLNWFTRFSEEVTGTLDISSILNFVVSCRVYPFSVGTLPNLSHSAGREIFFGTGAQGIGVGGDVRIIDSTIGYVDCGSVTVAPATPYNDFRDYYNTTVTCFLPFCGTVELNPIEVLNNSVQVIYCVDFYTGECTAIVYVHGANDKGYIAGVSNGVIGVPLPLSATNSGQLSSRHRIDNAKDSMLITSALSNLVSGVASAATGSFGGITSAVTNLANLGNQQEILTQQRYGRSAVLAPSLTGGSGAAAFALPATPYIQIRRGTYTYSQSPSAFKISYGMYAKTLGYSASTEGALGSFSGFTVCDNPNVTGINATDQEKSEIKMYLETGVIL